MRIFITMFLKYGVFKHLVVKTCADVNAEREQSHSDEQLVRGDVVLQNSVFALYAYYGVVLGFHNKGPFRFLKAYISM